MCQKWSVMGGPDRSIGINDTLADIATRRAGVKAPILRAATLQQGLLRTINEPQPEAAGFASMATCPDVGSAGPGNSKVLRRPYATNSCTCFGLDFAVVVNENLDERLELSDRLVVMFHGEFVQEARAGEANLTEIGRHIAGY
jgi:hypothetical protein